MKIKEKQKQKQKIYMDLQRYRESSFHDYIGFYFFLFCLFCGVDDEVAKIKGLKILNLF